MLLFVVAGALAVGNVWIPKRTSTSHAQVEVGAVVFSTLGLGGLGAGLARLTHGSALNLWVLVTLIVGLGGLACLIGIEQRLGDNAMLPVPLGLALDRRRELVHRAPLRSVQGHAKLDPVRAQLPTLASLALIPCKC